MEVSERSFGNRYFIFAISIVLIAFLLLSLLDRLDREMINAERAQFELRVAEMKASVLLMEANLVARNDMRSAGQYVGSNPMRLMKSAQDGLAAHYVGEKYLSALSSEQREELSGKWIFNVEDKQAIYFPRSTDAITQEYLEEKDLSLKFSVIGLRSEDRLKKEIYGLRLVPVE